VKTITVANPAGLPTIDHNLLVDFQGDLKDPIEPSSIAKLKASILRHGLFVPKFVWFDEQSRPNILDGHQTRQAMAALQADGYTIPPIPYVKVEAVDRSDAAEKLLQLNSQYARINPQSSWLQALPDMLGMLQRVQVPDLVAYTVETGPAGADPDLDGEPYPTAETIEPIHQVHVLVSVPVARYHEILPALVSLQKFEFVTYRRSGN